MSLLSKMRLARKEESGPGWFWSFMSCTIVIKDDNVKQWMLVDINNGWQNLDKNNIAGNWVAGHEGLGQVDRVWASSLFWCSAAKVVLTINYKLILEVILISVFKINSKNLLSSTLLKIIMINSKINTLIRGGVFVVANSLDEKNKAASNDYNTRVVECRCSRSFCQWGHLLANIKYRSSAEKERDFG